MKERCIILLSGLCVITLLFLYRTYNPLESNLFPKCIFFKYTGYLCPGCGSQRAIHYLLNIDVLSAIKQNVLVVLFIPYLFMVTLSKIFPNKLLKWNRVRKSPRFIQITLWVILGFWLLRNIL